MTRTFQSTLGLITAGVLLLTVGGCTTKGQSRQLKREKDRAVLAQYKAEREANALKKEIDDASKSSGSVEQQLKRWQDEADELRARVRRLETEVIEARRRQNDAEARLAQMAGSPTTRPVGP